MHKHIAAEIVCFLLGEKKMVGRSIRLGIRNTNTVIPLYTTIPATKANTIDGERQ